MNRGIPAPVMVIVCAAMFAAIGLLLLMPGGSDSTSTALSPIAQAAERTAQVPGGRMSGTGSGTFPGGSMSMRFEGVYNGETDQTSMTTDVQVSGPASMSTSFSMVQDGLMMYMSSPMFASVLPNGASWMRVDLTDFAGDEAQAQAGAVDGRHALDSLAAVGGAQVVGTERVRGVNTTQYSATIEGESPTAVSVWIDDKGMVRRTAMDMPFAIPGQAASRMTMSFDFYDFGIEPQIAIPPASATFDATELSLQALEASGG